MTKKLFALLLVVALIFSLAACGKAAETNEAPVDNKEAATAEVNLEQEEIVGEDDTFDPVAEIKAIEGLEDSYSTVFLTKTLTNPFFVAMQVGYEETMAAARPNDTVNTVECQNDASVMLQEAETVANGGYAICLLTIINSSDYSIMKSMTDNGIMVILLDTLCTDEGLQYISGSVVTDNYSAGYNDGVAFCELLTAKYGEPKGTCVIFENPSGTVTAQRIQGFEDGCADNGEVEVLYRETGKGQIDAGLEFMEKVLNLYTDEDLDGVMAMNDPSAQGCGQAIKDAGYEPNTIYVFGVDGSDESIVKINEGYQTGTSLQYPGTMASRGLVIAYKQIAGQELSDAEKFLQISTTYINADNCNDYAGFSYIGK